MKHILSVAALMLSAHAVAESTYVVGVEDARFMPHYSLDAQGEYQGFARELLDAFAEESGARLIYRPLPVDELLPALLTGRVDFKYPDNPGWSGSAKADHRLHYSQAAVSYVDGVMVAPRRAGLGVEQLKRLAVVDGWTPKGYEARIDAGQVLLVGSSDLPRMIRQAMLKDTDGAYYNIVVAMHYLNNVRTAPGALVFEPKLPHTRGTYHLSSVQHPELIQRFDRFLNERRGFIAALKNEHKVEIDPDSEYIGMEQWKVDFLERQKAKKTASD